MPESVYIGNVNGDVYIESGGPGSVRLGPTPMTPPLPSPVRGGSGGLVRYTDRQLELDRSTDASIELMNISYEETRISMLTGLVKEYLIGAGMGLLAGQITLSDKIFDSNATRLFSMIEGLQPLAPVVVPPVSNYEVVISAIGPGFPRGGLDRFFSPRSFRISGMVNQHGAVPVLNFGENSIFFTIKPSGLEAFYKLVEEANNDPDLELIPITIDVSAKAP